MERLKPVRPRISLSCRLVRRAGMDGRSCSPLIKWSNEIGYDPDEFIQLGNVIDKGMAAPCW